MAARTPCLLRALSSLSSSLSSSSLSTTSLPPAAATVLNVFSSSNAAAQQHQSGTRSYCATHMTQPCRNPSLLHTARSSIALPHSLSAAGLCFSSGGSTAGRGDGAGSSSSSSTDGSGSSSSLQVRQSCSFLGGAHLEAPVTVIMHSEGTSALTCITPTYLLLSLLLSLLLFLFLFLFLLLLLFLSGCNGQAGGLGSQPG